MDRVAEEVYRCSKCKLLKPKTGQCFYFDKRGRVTGYCKPCHAAWFRDYAAAGRLRRPPHYGRDWRRKRYQIPETRWKQRDDEAAS